MSSFVDCSFILLLVVPDCRDIVLCGADAVFNGCVHSFFFHNQIRFQNFVLAVSFAIAMEICWLTLFMGWTRGELRIG